LDQFAGLRSSPKAANQQERIKNITAFSGNNPEAIRARTNEISSG
jgi:hypothetical protein